MNILNNKCPICSYEIKGTPLMFTCTHLLCPYCYIAELFKQSFSCFSLSSRTEITVKCTTCNKGCLILPLKKFLSYLHDNEYKHPLCSKHNKESYIYCHKCKLNLCDDCISLFHEDYFPDHSVQYDPPIDILTKYCSVHKEKKIKYKCEDCQMYLCKVCVKEKHDKHKCTKLSDYLNMAIARIKFQEYNDYVKFLNWKEIATKDQVNSDKIKTLDIIDRCINDLQEAKKQYIQDIKETNEDITNLFNFNRQLYYYYYQFLNCNNADINPILLYEKENYTIDKKLKNKKLFKFLFSYFKPAYTFPYLEKILLLIRDFSSKPPYTPSLSKLYVTSKQSFYLTKRDANNNLIRDSVSSITVIPEKDIYAVSSYSGYIHIFSTKVPEKEIICIKAHEKGISSLICTITTEPLLLISASYDKTINLYNIETEEPSLVCTLKGHKGEITCMLGINLDEYSSEETDKENDLCFCTGSKDFNIKIWSVLQKKCKRTLTGHKAPVLALCCLTKQKLISSSEDLSLMIWNLELYECEKIFEFKDYSMMKCIMRYDDNRILVEGNKGEFMCFNLETAKFTGTFKKHDDEVTDLIYLKKTKQVVSCSKDQKMCLWDIEKDICDCVVSGHTSGINTMCVLMRNNNKFITGGSDGEVIIWESAY